MNKSSHLVAMLVAASALTLTVPIYGQTWNGSTDGNWGTNSNWSSTPTFGTNADLTFYSSGASNLTTFLGGSRTIRSLTFNENADSNVNIGLTNAAGSGVTLTLNGGGNGASIVVNSGAEGNFSIGTVVSGSAIILADNLLINHSGSGKLTFNRGISGAPYSLTKTGTGTLVFTIANTFGGGLNINGGTVEATLNGTTDLGATGSTITLAGGRLLFTKAAAVTYNNLNFVTAADTSSTLTYNETSGSDNSLAFTTYSTTLNGNLLVQNISASAGVDMIDWVQNISGAGRITFEGNNDLSSNYTNKILRIRGDNANWSGGLDIRKGAVNINSTNALGTGSLILGETASSNGAALYHALGTASYTNDIVVRSGSGLRTIQTTANGNSTWAGNLSLEGTFTYEKLGTGTDNFTGVLSGVGSLVKSGSGLVRLDNANTFSGSTRITAGGLQLAKSLALQNSTLNLAGTDTGTLNFGALTSATIGGLTGTRNLVLTNTSAAAVALTVGNNNANTSYSGNITGTGASLTKVGNGTLTLAGSNSYTGSTLVNNGTLLINGSTAAGSSLTVASAGTLGGIGTIGGATTISGRHSPGNSPGIQNFASSLIYQSGASVLTEIVANSTANRGVNFDGINVSGALAFNGSTTMSLNFNYLGSTVDWSDSNFWGTSITGTSGWLIYSGASSLTGFTNLGIVSENWADGLGALFNDKLAGNTFTLYQSNNDIYLNYNVVPEPTTWALLLGSLLLFAIIRRRPKKS